MENININVPGSMLDALERARKLAPHYFIFNKKWIKLMKFIKKDKVFKKYLEGRWL